MTKVYFVRHAQPNYDNHDDTLRELTAKGMEDRKLVTSFLADKNIQVALSSPYKRSIDTIRHFTEQNNLEIKIIEDFRERKIDSVWIEDFAQFSKNQWADFSYKLSDGECLKEVQDRNIAALKQVVQEYAGQNIVVGSHGTALSTIIQYYRNSYGYEDFERIRLLMPWIVEFAFDEEGTCVAIKEHDVFTEV